MRLALSSFVGIWCLSIEASAWVMSRPLEMWYTAQALPSESAEAIVVLSGAVHRPVPNRPYHLSAQDTYRRVKHAAWLFQNWRPLPILVSGGGAGEMPIAETMRRLLLTEGIPTDRIWLDSRAMNTHESAVYGSEIRGERYAQSGPIVQARWHARCASARALHGPAGHAIRLPARMDRNRFERRELSRDYRAGLVSAARVDLTVVSTPWCGTRAQCGRASHTSSFAGGTCQTTWTNHERRPA